LRPNGDIAAVVLAAVEVSMRNKLISLAVVVALFSCGCGDDGPRSPNAPTPTPTVAALTITPATDLLKISQTETLAATASMSDGSSRALAGSWSSDAPAVATVDANGRVTGVGSGDATIAVDAQGVRATRRLHVIPDYQGRWSGDWRVAGCAADGDWSRVDFCRELPIGSRDALTVVLTQDRATVSGNADFGGLQGPVQGSIRADGLLALSGTFTVSDEGLVFEIAIADWQTVTTDNQRMTGRFTITLRASGIQGSGRIDGELRVVAKDASPALSSSAPGSSTLRRSISRLRSR
jgi:hypothetical protein